MARKKSPTPEDIEENRQVALDKAIGDLTKRYGDGTIMRLGESHLLDVDIIPTGSLSLDIALGTGGIPRGRITEIYGPESSGKTTICQHIVAEAQSLGGTCAFIDMEHALDPSYAARCGVNVDSLLISQPDMGEQALNALIISSEDQKDLPTLFDAGNKLVKTFPKASHAKNTLGILINTSIKIKR